MPHTIAQALLAAARQKERDSLLTGWGDNTIPVEVVEPDLPRFRQSGESIAMMAWRGDYIAEKITPRDAHLYGGVA